MSQGILIQLVPFLVRVKNFLLPFPVVDGSTPTLDLQLNGLLFKRHWFFGSLSFFG
jgi:hypothetical protein